jgi:hypothetical protein
MRRLAIEAGFFPFWEYSDVRYPLPLPLESLFSSRYEEFSAQNLEPTGVTGKVFLIKELGWILSGCKEALAGRQVKDRE